MARDSPQHANAAPLNSETTSKRKDSHKHHSETDDGAEVNGQETISSTLKEQYTTTLANFQELCFHGINMSELFDKYSEEEDCGDVRDLVGSSVATFKDVAKPFTTKPATAQEHDLDRLQDVFADLHNKLKIYAPKLDADDQEQHFNEDELEMLERNISKWGVTDMELAVENNFHERLSPMQRLELRLRANQLARESSDVGTKMILNCKSWQDRNESDGVRRALAQLRKIDNILHFLTKPKKIRSAKERDYVKDLKKALADIGTRLEESFKQADHVPLSKRAINYDSDDDEIPVVMLQRIEKRFDSMMAVVIIKREVKHGYSEWDDQIVKKMQKRFAELCDVLMPLGDDEDDASGDEAESESKTDVPREWLDFTAKEN